VGKEEVNRQPKQVGRKPLLFMKLFKQFTFEAAHSLPDFPQVHGHSYYVEVWVQGTAADGYVMRESEIEKECYFVKTILDHKYLNDFIDLPTSENIARHIWILLNHLPLFEIRIERPTIGLGIVFNGDFE
jgi:6-pyruvoyltetrahydropterin/6-carboxytetrahydropterin synthase